MIDYSAAYDNPGHKRYAEARALAIKLWQETILITRGIETGVLRWKKTGAVISKAEACLAYHLGIRLNRDACTNARHRETIDSLSAAAICSEIA